MFSTKKKRFPQVFKLIRFFLKKKNEASILRDMVNQIKIVKKA